MRKVLLAAACFALFATQAQAAKLYISEYTSLPFVQGYLAQIATEPGLDQTPVDFSGGAASSAAFSKRTTYVRVLCDVQCSVLFGAAPAATNANKVLPALTPEYFAVTPGQSLKISVISNP